MRAASQRSLQPAEKAGLSSMAVAIFSRVQESCRPTRKHRVDLHKAAWQSCGQVALLWRVCTHMFLPDTRASLAAALRLTESQPGQHRFWIPPE